MYNDTANFSYVKLIKDIDTYGEVIETRNGVTKRLFDVKPFTFDSFPLVTIRKTAWKMAIREMEWFMSGDEKCPNELYPWWSTQLSKSGSYLDGYGKQLRHFSGGGDFHRDDFDQIDCLIEGLKEHPNSRRHVITTWNPDEMYYITDTNDNPLTPTCCHSTLVQFFVSRKILHMKSYQRSADVLLGLPHNWVQSWALLMYLASICNYHVGTLTWILGDAHIYQDESHVEVVKEFNSLNMFNFVDKENFLCYNHKVVKGETPPFLASDFSVSTEIQKPLVLGKPILL